MMQTSKFRTLVGVTLLLLAGSTGRAVPVEPRIDPKAEAVLRKMSDSLASAKSFTFRSSESVDEYSPSGQQVEVGKDVTIAVRRPSAVMTAIDGEDEKVTFTFDDGRVGIVNDSQKCYATVDGPKTIDAMFDFLADKYGITTPLCDLLFADPHKTLTEHVRSGEYLGRARIAEQECHHLAFRQDAIDWQIWIEDAERAVPRKLVITHKELPGYPKFVAFLNDWNLSADPSAETFKFTAPPDYKKIELTPLDEAPKAAAPAAAEQGK